VRVHACSYTEYSRVGGIRHDAFTGRRGFFDQRPDTRRDRGSGDGAPSTSPVGAGSVRRPLSRHETPQSRSVKARPRRPLPKNEAQGPRRWEGCLGCHREEKEHAAPGRWHDRKVAADHLAGRRGKARDFASLASPALLIAPNHCQQMICVGDAKLETARGSRHGFCVRVTRSSRLHRSRLVS
jgi:hypothetical protein